MYQVETCIRHTDFFLGLLFNPEDEGSMTLDSQLTTRRHIPEIGVYFEYLHGTDVNGSGLRVNCRTF
jgi:hypothetical protein